MAELPAEIVKDYEFLPVPQVLEGRYHVRSSSLEEDLREGAGSEAAREDDIADYFGLRSRSRIDRSGQQLQAPARLKTSVSQLSPPPL